MGHIHARYLLPGAVEKIKQGMGVCKIGFVYGIVKALPAG